MKKPLFLLVIVLLAGISSYAQKDTTKPVAKKDSVIVPAFEKVDTARVNFTYVIAGTTQVAYAERGYVIVKGFAVQNEEKKWQWVREPDVIAVLNEKRQPVRKILQVYQ